MSTPETTSPGLPAQQSSLEAAVQARRAQLLSEDFIDIPVQSWGARLVAKYRGITWKETRSRISQNPDAAISETTTAADLLLAASVDVYFLEDDGSKQSLGPWPTAVAKLGADSRLTPRQALMTPGIVFKRDTQMMAHFALLEQWQQGADDEVHEVLVGESAAPNAAS